MINAMETIEQGKGDWVHMQGGYIFNLSKTARVGLSGRVAFEQRPKGGKREGSHAVV